VNPHLIGDAEQPPADAATVERTLAAVRRIASELLLDAPRSPRSLRVRAGEVCVELDWPESATAHSPVPAVPPAGGDPAPDGTHLTAATVGVFYRAPQPGAPAFVSEGDLVAPGQQVAIIEAMKLMIPVEADRVGRISAVLVSDGQPVEYGQPLFALELEAR
jgi:acetyl-CoA carboxylase biotin carboxyl carrier protein